MLVLKHADTGEVIHIDRKKLRFRRIAQGFVNKCREKQYFMKFITLTQGPDWSDDPKMLNNFLNKMRRRYGAVCYIWAKEIQMGRYEKTGEPVPHWHIIMGFPDIREFTADDIRRIQRYWGCGNVDIKPLRGFRKALNYIMKYVSKAFDLGLNTGRIMGSSKIEGYLRQSWNRVIECYKFFAGHGGHPADIWWTNGRGYIKYPDEYGRERKEVIYRPPRSKWRLSFG